VYSEKINFNFHMVNPLHVSFEKSETPCFTTGDAADDDFPSRPERETNDDVI